MKLFALALVMLTALAFACSSPVDLEATPEIHIGQDVCQQCGMIISEARYASAYRLASGEQKLFDDIGDMLAHYQAHEDEVAVFWVHDFNSLEWVRADQAYIVASDELSTPMGHGLVAFSREPDANTFAGSVNGSVHTFEELLTEQP